MHTIKTRSFWITACITLMAFALSGCFQQAGRGLDPAAFQENLPTFTPAVIEEVPPTEEIPAEVAEVPTETPDEALPFDEVEGEVADGNGEDTVDELPLDAMVEAPTEETPLAVEELPVEETPVEVVQLPTVEPTFTPTPTETLPPTVTPTPTITQTTIASITPMNFPTEEATAAAVLPTQTQTPNVIVPTLTPEADVPDGDALMGAFAITQTAEDQGIEGFDVAQAQEGDGALDNPVQQQPIDPLAQTATAIVLGATQTVEFEQTATAFAIFGVPTTEPPPAIIEETPLDTQPQQPFPTATPAPVIGGADCIHEVRVEDRNLYRISLRYGVPVNTIAAVSGIVNPNLIIVGDRLTIPNCGTTGAVPPPTSTPVPVIDANAQAVGNVPATSSSICGPLYLVEQGETLFEISQRCGVPVNTIAAANGIANINLIFLNQELVIP